MASRWLAAWGSLTGAARTTIQTRTASTCTALLSVVSAGFADPGEPAQVAHAHFDHPGPFAGFAAAAGGVEGEMALAQALGPGFGGGGEQVADQIEGTGVGGRVGAGGAADGVGVDGHQAAELGSAQAPGERLQQRGLAGPGDARDDVERFPLQVDRDPSQVVAGQAGHPEHAGSGPHRPGGHRGAQPARTRQVDLRVDEAALWGDMRKKWRQYVNKARRSGIRVVDASVDRLPEFYSIYRETAKRAGFVIRTYESYLGVWNAFARLGMARLLMAEGPDGVGLATLFLLRVGDRVIEPYGGMTEAGAECRANYLLKWEAIRTSREQGAASYDMWGLSHEGIEHFKAGFGGREIKYIGAWDLVLNPAGRLAFDGGQAVQDRIGAWRHGILKVRGRRHGAAEQAAE